MDDVRSTDTAESLDRRAFLGGAAAAVPLACAGSLQAAQDAERARSSGVFPGMLRRQTQPDNLEFPFPTLSTFLTPTEQFFVRNHFEPPTLDAKTWRLRVEGCTERSFELSYEELRKMTPRTVTALLECSGNSRVLLKPPQLGIRWDQGAVGTAEWTGIPLAAILERAGVRADAVQVIAEGADKGKFDAPAPKTPGEIPYARALPLAKARHQDVLLAYQMNGQELAPAHGYPVRLLVPGWYGMASVKWLQRLLVVERPFHGYFETFQYTIWERRSGLPDLVPVTETQVKAQIARPMLDEVIAAGSRYRIHGAAWAGEAEVTRVEVSTDGGTHWHAARLLGKPTRYAWRLWEYEWAVAAQSGHATLMARATDDRRRVQPLERDEDRRDAMINHVQRIKVAIR